MRDSSLGPLLAVFYGCGFLAGFNENLVNMALVAIMGDFSIDAVAAQWLVTGYMIAVTVVVTCMAYLYRRLSMRTLFFAAAALSIAGSAGGFLAPNFPLLLVARLVQAAGTGVFIPLMMNVIVDRVPHGRLGTYLAIGSAMITIGPATAPIVTGFMVSDWGWRSVFLVPLAAAVALTVAGIFVVRGGREPELVRFDLPSALLTAAGVTLLCVGLSEVTLRPAVGAAALIGAALALGWFAPTPRTFGAPSCVYGAAAPRNVLAGGAARHGDDDDLLLVVGHGASVFRRGGGACGQRGRRAHGGAGFGQRRGLGAFGARSGSLGRVALAAGGALPSPSQVWGSPLPALLRGRSSSPRWVSSLAISARAWCSRQPRRPGCAACPTSWIPTA